MNKPVLTTEHASSQEPIQERRQAALRSVDLQSRLHEEFAEKYGFLDNQGQPNIPSALEHLNHTFFKDLIEKGMQVTDYHRTLVIQVSLETDLNPFNNEIYALQTPFGDLKCLATMDGWMKLATSEPLTSRSFVYSESDTEILIGDQKYVVPEWIECHLEHKHKGKSVAREYFHEVFQNAQHHLPSWSRPARMLAHVSFIQALRRMLRISALADSDIISDITKEYEAVSVQAQSQLLSPKAKEAGTASASTSAPAVAKHSTRSGNQPRKLNITLDDIEVVEPESGVEQAVNDGSEPEVKESVVTTETETTQENELASVSDAKQSLETEPAQEAIEAVESKPTSEQVVTALAATSTLEVDETHVNRTILQIIKPFIERTWSGELSIDGLLAKRSIISDPIGLAWFDGEVAKLKAQQ